jgi:hypothetical protein
MDSTPPPQSMVESIHDRVDELLDESRQLSARQREILTEVEALLEVAARMRPQVSYVH